MKQILLLTISLFALQLQAQDFSITGKTIDAQGISLESATVYLEKLSDSSLVTYAITDKDGIFYLSLMQALSLTVKNFL